VGLEDNYNGLANQTLCGCFCATEAINSLDIGS
jgi:hypothetical protein